MSEDILNLPREWRPPHAAAFRLNACGSSIWKTIKEAEQERSYEMNEFSKAS